VFGSDAAEVKRNGDGANHARNAQVHVATYQTLGVDGVDGDASFLAEHYPEDNFSHVVIDECHRSAWGKWSQVLTRNPHAVQVGLTATPRTLKTGKKTKEAEQDAKISADNRKYFGEPVYEYDMAQAMEDGYLAVCEIQKGRVNLDDTGLSLDDIMAHNPRDAITGLPVTREALKARYEKTSFEDRLLLPDRVLKMCDDLFLVSLPDRRAGAKDHRVLRPRPARRRCGHHSEQPLYSQRHSPPHPDPLPEGEGIGRENVENFPNCIHGVNSRMGIKKAARLKRRFGIGGGGGTVAPSFS
jgi:hypothetical protein